MKYFILVIFLFQILYPIPDSIWDVDYEIDNNTVIYTVLFLPNVPISLISIDIVYEEGLIFIGGDIPCATFWNDMLECSIQEISTFTQVHFIFKINNYYKTKIDFNISCRLDCNMEPYGWVTKNLFFDNIYLPIIMA